MARVRELAADVGAAINSFETLITPEPPTVNDALLKTRVVLVQAVNNYIAHLGSCLAGAKPHRQSGSWTLAYDDVLELRRRYSEHIGSFGASVIAANWQSYRASCSRLIAAMRRHLALVIRLDPID